MLLLLLWLLLLCAYLRVVYHMTRGIVRSLLHLSWSADGHGIDGRRRCDIRGHFYTSSPVACWEPENKVQYGIVRSLLHLSTCPCSQYWSFTPISESKVKYGIVRSLLHLSTAPCSTIEVRLSSTNGKSSQSWRQQDQHMDVVVVVFCLSFVLCAYHT